jgi:hypothetical protein
MAELGSLIFVVALLLTFFLRRTASTIALAAVLLCFPFYLYILMPGLYRRTFKGEYSVPLYRPFHWDVWAAVGVLSLLFVAVLSVRSYSKVRADIQLRFRRPAHRCYLAWRWRIASKRTTPAATETLSDFTGPVVGSETTKSQRLRVRSWRPLPSPPRTMPTGEV